MALGRAGCRCCLSGFSLVAAGTLCHFQPSAVPPHRDEMKRCFILPIFVCSAWSASSVEEITVSEKLPRGSDWKFRDSAIYKQYLPFKTPVYMQFFERLSYAPLKKKKIALQHSSRYIFQMLICRFKKYWFLGKQQKALQFGSTSQFEILPDCPVRQTIWQM